MSEVVRRKALVPDADNAVAEEIRRRTVCYICLERILDGQPIVVVRDERDKQAHERCYDEADAHTM